MIGKRLDALAADRTANKDAPGAAMQDPHYTIRAWRSVVTYLLRRQEFLYE